MVLFCLIEGLWSLILLLQTKLFCSLLFCLQLDRPLSHFGNVDGQMDMPKRWKPKMRKKWTEFTVTYCSYTQQMLPCPPGWTKVNLNAPICPLSGGMVEWFTCWTSNLRTASCMGSNLVRDKPLFP